MQEVVCFNCGRIVHISPDAELCSVCGENLRELIHPAYASKYFYDRAAAMAAGSDLLQALREIDRGLAYQPSSELRLLGAILSQRIGDFEQMRQHVAAVPVDDVLRTEAEWLLRAHQHRQRAQRTATRTPAAKHTQLAADELLSPFDEDLQLPVPLPHDKRTQPSTSPRAVATAPQQNGNRRVGIYFALLLLVAVTAGLALSSRENGLAFLSWLSAPSDSAGDGTPNDAEVVVPVHRAGTETAEDAPILSPTATPVGIPGDVVLVAPEPMAESTIGALVVNPLQPFDLATYLNAQGRSDLAALGVIASSQEGTVRLEGFVPSFMARQDLIELMEAAPGVSSVSGANILVRLPPTYTVAAGDTLWAISYYFYGEDKIAEIIAANRASLPASNMLTIGQELQIPAAE
jgi:LysM repeat protein